MTEIITRKAAFTAGRKRFFTGRPCIHGHIAERFVSTGNCVKCNAERSSAFRSDSRRVYVAKALGHFVYDLHPDDHAKALAFCQALDMQRGRKPSDGVKPVVQPITAEAMAQMRRNVYGLAEDAAQEAYGASGSSPRSEWK